MATSPTLEGIAAALDKLLNAESHPVPSPSPPWTKPVAWDNAALETAYKKAFYAAFHDDVPYMNNYASPAWEVLSLQTPTDPLFGVNNCIAYLVECRKLGYTAYDVLNRSHDPEMDQLYGTAGNGDPVKGARALVQEMSNSGILNGSYTFSVQAWTRGGRPPLNMNAWGPFAS